MAATLASSLEVSGFKFQVIQKGRTITLRLGGFA
jgi:hypothetical protein